MGDSNRQQVIFISHSLSHGGAEKVVYELAHALDLNRFEPVVIYLNDRKSILNYSPSIKTIYLLPEPDEDTTKNTDHKSIPSIIKRGIYNFLKGIYISIPKAIRNKILLDEKILKIINGVNQRRTNNQKLYDISDAVAEALPWAVSLRKMLDGFAQNAVLIPTEETHTVIAWLSQLSPRRKIIASEHAPYQPAQPLRYPDPNVRRVKEWMYLNACRSADWVTFPSESARWDLINNFGASSLKTITMPNPVDCDKIIQKSGLLPDFDQSKLMGKTIFTYVGRLSLEKDPYLLIESSDILRQKYRNFIVLIVGGGLEYEKMRGKIEALGLNDHIYLLGERENPYPYMAAARSLLLTSLTESFGLVLIEAMLCGAVPISTDCGTRETLADGKYGLLVPPGNPQLFADAMHQIALDDLLLNRLKKGAFEYARQYDKTLVVKKWEDLILKVAGK